MTDERDPTIDRVRTALAPLPAVSPSSIARVMAATARPARRPRWYERLSDWIGAPAVSLAGAGALAVAALALGFAVRDSMGRPVEPAVAVAPPSTSGGTGVATLAASAEAGMVAVQFVFEAPHAERVSVVGDFNEWQPAQAVMTRANGSGVWTATLRLRPGRHTYAFLVDGTTWVADPRAPRADDDDFGKPGSVLLVQLP